MKISKYLTDSVHIRFGSLIVCASFVNGLFCCFFLNTWLVHDTPPLFYMFPGPTPFILHVSWPNPLYFTCLLAQPPFFQKLIIYLPYSYSLNIRESWFRCLQREIRSNFSNKLNIFKSTGNSVILQTKCSLLYRGVYSPN